MGTKPEPVEECEEWILLEQAILSDQVPPDALVRIFAEQLAFGRWYRLRAEARAETKERNFYPRHLRN